MKSNLVPKRITDRTGRATTVWVKVGDAQTKKRAKTIQLMKDYRSILSKVNKDLSGPNWKEAAATRIMMHTGIRVGNEASASGFVSKVDGAEKHTFGLTTLTRDHVKFSGNTVTLEFTGKKSVEQSIKIKDPVVVAAVKRLYDEGHEQLLGGVRRYEVAKYMTSRLGDYTPKDLRMMRANREAIDYMAKMKSRPKPKTKTELNEEVNEILDHVSSVLGNTRGVAKRSYIDEFIIDSYKASRLKK
jgi:DNA topoisomerase-1